jgi:hypothetical protein
MFYNATASILYRERLDPTNSPSCPEYGEYKKLTTEIEAHSYYNLAKRLGEFFLKADGEIEIESVTPEHGGKFTAKGLEALYNDAIKINEVAYANFAKE